MKHGSLFSGIGGFDLAAEWMGWENVFHCEWNEFGQKVLKHHFPKAISYNDITQTDFTIHRGRIDIITGGFPCQPYSAAGKRLGKDDERHLWPHMLRAIREIQPRWVVGENVLGLVNWSGGLVFEEVQADLEAEGYEVQPYVLPAASVNAPHRRDRVWFVAYAHGNGHERGQYEGSSEDIDRQENEKFGSARTDNTGPTGSNGTTKAEPSFDRPLFERRDGKTQALARQNEICNLPQREHKQGGSSEDNGREENAGRPLVSDRQRSQLSEYSELGEVKATPERDKVQRRDEQVDINRVERNATNSDNGSGSKDTIPARGKESYRIIWTFTECSRLRQLKSQRVNAN